jgi:hypothetical protein
MSIEVQVSALNQCRVLNNQGRKYKKTGSGREERTLIPEHPTKSTRKSDTINSNPGNVNKFVKNRVIVWR